MHAFPIPVVAFAETRGPGSQQEDETLDYLPMPHEMRTFQTPILPEPEEVRERTAVRIWFDALHAAAKRWQRGMPAISLDMRALSPEDRMLIDQMLGEGEVSAQIRSETGTLDIQESVFAGVWRVRGRDAEGRVFAERVEIGDVPAAMRASTNRDTRGIAATHPAGPGVTNAPALLAEIAEHVARPPGAHHVINLSLLPFTPEDGAWLDACLGRGQVTLLSRGYGNCRITAAAMPRVWWVQYFNSQDALILNTIEITDIPEVARAAAEDLVDSAERIGEVLEWIG